MARIVDDRGRLFGRVNIVDLLVLLVIVAVVVFVAVRFASPTETVPVQITFLVKNIDNRAVEPFKSVGTLEDGGGNVIGTIEKADVIPTPVELVTLQGELKVFDSFVRSDVSIVVSTTGSVSGDTVHVGRLAARVGAIVQLVGPGYESTSIISDVVWGAEALK
jgi:Domain of unknown function (DUF4330)